jgi:hypothetical protein
MNLINKIWDAAQAQAQPHPEIKNVIGCNYQDEKPICTVEIKSGWDF